MSSTTIDPGISGAPVPEEMLRERLARLSLEQKVRLLTGADFWSLHPEPAIGRSAGDLRLTSRIEMR